MTFPPQIETVERHVADALDEGATALTGGHRGEGPGLYYEPTVLVNVNHDMACMREETFGPTLPVMRVSDVDEAVRRAGGTAVNDAIVQCLGYEAPFGGSADSGVGSRNAREGILKYTEPHTIMVTRVGLKRDVSWFPNSRRMTKLLEGAFARFYGR
jgi:acyl-CoA reductase-like NAD-dependent aldehyde dehydrogenase